MNWESGVNMSGRPVAITNGRFSATVDPDGAWITSFLLDGQPLFYDKRSLTVDGVEKSRGGCHVCLPNFGPGGASGLTQHGYGRKSEWSIKEQSETTISMFLEHGMDAWRELSSTITYNLVETGLQFDLTVVNNGSLDLQIAPGFHPYFSTEDNEVITVNTLKYDLKELGTVQFIDGHDMALQIGGRVYELSSSEFAVWALWSDRVGDYVCLEPTDSGNSFDEGTAGYIAPGQARSWNVTISVQR